MFGVSGMLLETGTRFEKVPLVATAPARAAERRSRAVRNLSSDPASSSTVENCGLECERLESNACKGLLLVVLQLTTSVNFSMAITKSDPAPTLTPSQLEASSSNSAPRTFLPSHSATRLPAPTHSPRSPSTAPPYQPPSGPTPISHHTPLLPPHGHHVHQHHQPSATQLADKRAKKRFIEALLYGFAIWVGIGIITGSIVVDATRR